MSRWLAAYFSRTSDLVLVPSKEHEEEWLKSHASSDSQVDVLPRFEAYLFQKLSRCRVASYELSRLLLKRALLEGKFTHATLSLIRPSDLVHGLMTSLGELYRAGTSVADLRSASSLCDAARDRERLVFLADAFNAHQQSLHHMGLIDARAIPSELAKELEKEIHSELLTKEFAKTKNINVLHLLGASPARLRWLEILHQFLAKSGREVRVAFPDTTMTMLGRVGIRDSVEVLASRLESRWASMVQAPSMILASALAEEGATEKEGESSRLSLHLFSDNTEHDESSDQQKERTVRSTEKDHPYWLVSATDIYVEAETVAAEAAQAFRHGYASGGIVIVLPSLQSPLTPLIRCLLAEHGLPVAEDPGADWSKTPLVSGILALLRALARGAHKADVVQAIWGCVSANTAARRRAIVRAWTKTAGSDLMSDGEALLASIESEDDRAWVSLLIDAAKRAKRKPERGEMIRLIFDILALLGTHEAVERDLHWMVRNNEQSLLDAVGVQAAAWRVFSSVLDEIHRASVLLRAENLPCSLEELVDEIEELIQVRWVAHGQSAAAIRLCEAKSIVGLSFDVLIIADTHEGALPRRANSDVWLQPAVVAALRKAAPENTPQPKAIEGAVDLAAVCDAISKVRKRLVVVFRTSDEDGRPLLPGALAIELARHADVRRRHERRQPILKGSAAARRPQDVSIAFHHAASAHVELAKSTPLYVEPQVFARALVERHRLRYFMSSTLNRASPDKFTGSLLLSDAILQQRFRKRLRGTAAAPVSVTSLEDLLNCPFVVFAGRVLGAIPDVAIADDGGDRAAGELAHEALLSIYSSLGHAYESRTQLGFPNEIRSLAAVKIDPYKSASALQRVRRERLVEDVTRLVLNDTFSRDARWIAGEVAFGPDEQWPPLLLHMDESDSQDNAIVVAGRIDRIDIEQNGDEKVAVVIDYKARVPDSTGSVKYFKEARRGAIQLALYAQVAFRNMESKPQRVFARFLGYRDHSVGNPIGVSRSDDGTWKFVAGSPAGGQGNGLVIDEILSAMRSFREGNVPAKRSWRCEQCEFRAACRAPLLTMEGAES